MTQPRALFLSSIDMWTESGIAQGQSQLLSAVCSAFPGSVELLSGFASPQLAEAWVEKLRLDVRVLRGVFPWLARLNSTLWYGGGVVLCNKLRLIDRFRFPITTPLPQSWIDRYEIIVCYYAWNYHLLGLKRASAKVVVDTGDVMADRHERIGRRRWISLTAEAEGSVLRSANRCLAVSKDDADEFERLYGVRPDLLSFVPPNSGELLDVASEPRPERLGFMGAPSYVNEEILRLFSQQAFLERLKAAGIELLIAGGICNTADSAVLRALQAGGARILGHVASSADYYREIGATVNPVGPSTGVKIKSVETLVAGRTLITTRWGADSVLAASFPGQVVYTDWPIDPGVLADVCIRAVQSTQLGSRAVAEAYVTGASRSLKEYFAR